MSCVPSADALASPHCRVDLRISRKRLMPDGRRIPVGIAAGDAVHLTCPLFDLIEILHGLTRVDTHLGEFARARKYLALERTDGLVVVIEAAAQIFTELRQVFGKRAEALIEIFAQVTDLLGVLGEVCWRQPYATARNSAT